MNKLDAMQMFVRVAEAGSFIAVAQQLQVARSVVTRQVAALEHHLGTQLITRSTRSLTLTAAGVAYLEQCRRILNMVDAAESGLSAESTVSRGRIRLGLPDALDLLDLLLRGRRHPDRDGFPLDHLLRQVSHQPCFQALPSAP